MPDADDNNDCFVVSPIGEIGTPTFTRAKNVLDYIIKPAAEAVCLKAVRADDLSQPGSIATQIIQQLINAKAVIADLTDLNPNVFYELAVRDSFGAAVVLIAETGTKLPFDVIQQRTIFFDSTDLASAIPAIEKISTALSEALKDPGGGSPVRAAVDLNSLRSGNPEERQVASLAAKIEQMSRQLVTLEQRLPDPALDPSLWQRRETTGLFRQTRDRLEAMSVDKLLSLARFEDASLPASEERAIRDEAREILIRRGVSSKEWGHSSH